METEAVKIQLFSGVCREVTPHDTTELKYQGRYAQEIYVGGTGNLEVIDQTGTACTIESIPVGSQFKISPLKIMSTGTTATKIVAFF